MSTPTPASIGQTLIDTSNFTALAGTMLLMGMAVAAFTKAGKGKKAGAKVGFAFTGLFLLAGTALLMYVAVEISIKKQQLSEKEA